MKYRQEILIRKLLSKPFWLSRKHFKYISFRKECGIDVRDFTAPVDEWAKIKDYNGGKNTLCWNYYCDYQYLSRNSS